MQGLGTRLALAGVAVAETASRAAPAARALSKEKGADRTDRRLFKHDLL